MRWSAPSSTFPVNNRPPASYSCITDGLTTTQDRFDSWTARSRCRTDSKWHRTIRCRPPPERDLQEIAADSAGQSIRRRSQTWSRPAGLSKCDADDFLRSKLAAERARSQAHRPQPGNEHSVIAANCPQNLHPWTSIEQHLGFKKSISAGPEASTASQSPRLSAISQRSEARQCRQAVAHGTQLHRRNRAGRQEARSSG